MKKELKITEYILSVAGIAILVLILSLGGAEKAKSGESVRVEEAKEQSQGDQVCKVDGLECLFVGCNGFF